MLKIRPIQTGDLEFVRANPYQESVKDLPDVPMPLNAFAFEFNGKIVGIGGVRIFYKGVGESWLILTKHATKDSLFGFRMFYKIREQLNAVIAEHGLWRVEAQVRADSLEGIRLIENLGFTFDCTRVQFCPDGSDMLLYSRVEDL